MPNIQFLSITQHIIHNMGTSNYGLHREYTNSPIDSFTISNEISKLLTPSYGMTEDEKSSYLSKIRAKLESGQKLSGEEMHFLRTEAPDLYLQAARVQRMRESFETRLKQCQSKQEVSNTYLDSVSIIPKDDIMKECIVAAYDDVLKEFKQTGEYQSLPNKKEEKHGN